MTVFGFIVSSIFISIFILLKKKQTKTKQIIENILKNSAKFIKIYEKSLKINFVRLIFDIFL